MAHPKMIITVPDKGRQTYVISRLPLVIGKGSRCHIQITATVNIGDTHLELSYDSRMGLIVAQDLQSGTPTQTRRGNAIHRHMVVNGDALFIGDTRLDFVYPPSKDQLAASKGGGAPVLKVILGPGAPMELALAGQVNVGRASTNQLHLPDAGVSGKHASFRPDPSGRPDALGRPRWAVFDLGSRNGTRVNGDKLDANKGRLIQFGDVVEVGPTTIVYQLAGMPDISDASDTHSGANVAAIAGSHGGDVLAMLGDDSINRVTVRNPLSGQLANMPPPPPPPTPAAGTSSPFALPLGSALGSALGDVQTVRRTGPQGGIGFAAPLMPASQMRAGNRNVEEADEEDVDLGGMAAALANTRSFTAEDVRNAEAGMIGSGSDAPLPPPPPPVVPGQRASTLSRSASTSGVAGIPGAAGPVTAAESNMIQPREDSAFTPAKDDVEYDLFDLAGVDHEEGRDAGMMTSEIDPRSAGSRASNPVMPIARSGVLGRHRDPVTRWIAELPNPPHAVGPALVRLPSIPDDDGSGADRHLTLPPSVSLPAGMFILGRRNQANLRLGHSEVSGQHCRITVDGDTIDIEDLGSLNGTYVAEVRIAEKSPISPYAEIVVGPFRFFYLPRGQKFPPRR